MNRLAEETSPYLQQHADNPVDWYPWGEEALEKARSEDKPILLSVGYAACHWCHVMAHESFEDSQTAGLMNELFVNIKVDREERPDLDRIYQAAHQLIARRPGGWPLTMFLNPVDQVPFFGGTYFPGKARYGMPSFQDVLGRVASFYREQGEQIRYMPKAYHEAARAWWLRFAVLTAGMRCPGCRTLPPWKPTASRSRACSTGPTADFRGHPSFHSRPTWSVCCDTGGAPPAAPNPTWTHFTW